MNLNIRKPALAILFVLLATHLNLAFADTKTMDLPDLTTAKLNRECSAFIEGKLQETNFSQGLCIGIILGVEDNARYDKKICVPNNVSLRERVLTVRDYVSTQPKRMNEAFASLVFDALIVKWPCKNKA
ncbi:Rap1a/Tai family immunity protein [Polynucleobacter alcilacus]|uniref:Rap1a/Tai family immunity protein n=1 Tax=Polynucleobacter alcilacus TaxID=1819739 RepID=UPI001C0D9DA9